MDMETYEEVRIGRDDEWAQYLPEGTNCDLLFYNGEVISVEPPQNMDLKVTQSDPAVKGNTAQGATKPATLETGATVQVCLAYVPSLAHGHCCSAKGNTLVRRDSCLQSKIPVFVCLCHIQHAML